MGRREGPLDPDAGPVQAFAADLRELRQKAGGVTYRAMARQVGYAVTTLARAASGEHFPTLPVTVAYVTACGGDVAEWRQRWHHVADELAAQPSGEDEAVSPYQGLARFEAEDRHRFFGRERLTEDLARLVHEHRFVTVFGPSGSGKSSLLRAGLVPRLQQPGEAGPQVAALRILTPGDRPLHRHEHALSAAPGPGETWLLVDQFEEVFTLCRADSERDAFIDRLLRAQQTGDGLRVVLGVRADFYGRCLQHRGLAAAISGASLPVVPMSPAELREAIVRPAAAEGLIVERALTSRLVEETMDEPGGLPLMSHALVETWRRRKGRALTMDAYEASGGVAGAIARTAEDLCSRLTPDQIELARRILLRLISPGYGTPDTRRPAPRGELDTGDASGTAQVLDRLVKARLVTLEENTVELAHEAVITGWPRLRAWIEESRERLRVHRQLTEAAAVWDELGRDAGALYRGIRLAVAEEHFADAPQELTELESAFLQAGVLARDQERLASARAARRLRRFTAALSVLLVLTLVAGLVAWQQSRSSDRERDRALSAQRVALSRQLAAQSTALRGSDPDLAALLAVQAYRTEPTPEAISGLYAAAGHPLRNRITGYPKPVDAVAFSPDGRTLVTGSDDNVVRLRDVATGKLRATLTGHTDEVSAVEYSPDGRTLASSSDDKTVRLWDPATGRPRAVLTGHRGGVYTLAFSRDGRTLATGSRDGTVRLWDVTARRTRAIAKGHTGIVAAVAFSPDGRTLATGGWDRTARLWDTATGRRRATLTGHTNTVGAVTFSPDGRTLATGGYDETVRLWDPATHRRRTTLTGYSKGVVVLRYSPDGRTLAIAHYATVRLRDVATGTTRTLGGHTGTVFAMAFSPDGRTLATGSVDKTVRLWDATSGTARATLTGHTGEVVTAAYAPDGRTLVTGGWDRTVRLWDAATGKSRATLTKHAGSVYAVAVSPDSRTLASGGHEGELHLWDLRTGRHRRTVSAGRRGDLYMMAFSPDGHTLAGAGKDLAVRLWDVATGRVRAKLTGHTQPVAAVAYSPDGRTLATGSTDGTVRLWDTATGRTRATLKRHTNTVAALAFSPDGRVLASGSWDRTVQLWDTATGRARSTLTGHTDDVQAAAFSPDGRTLATGGTDRTVRLWDTATGTTRTTFTGHTNTVAALGFAPDGRTLAAADYAKTVRLWNIDLPTPAEAADKVCRALHRDLTPLERSTYLAEGSDTAVCSDGRAGRS